MARYRKVDVRMRADEKFRALSPPPPNGQDCWQHLLTNRFTTSIPGLYAVFEESMARDLGWPLEGYRKAFAEVFAQGMAKADWTVGLVFVPNAIKYDPPQSPNVIKSWAATWDEIPECDLKREAYERLYAFAKGLGEAWAKAFAEACPRPSGKALANPDQDPEQEPEQEQEQEHPTGSAQKPLAGDSGQQVMGAVEESESTPKVKPSQPDVAAVIQRYCSTWIAVHKPSDGRSPPLTRGDKGQAVALVRNHGVEQALAFVTQFLDDPDPWLFEKRHPLSLLGRQVSRYLATAPPPSPARPPPGSNHGLRKGVLDPIPAQPETKDCEI